MTCARAISNSPSARCRAHVSLDGLRIVVDCANGAAYKVAPEALVGTRRGSLRHRLRAGRPQHQSRRRLDRAGRALGEGARDARRYRHRARWRRRPRPHRRRTRPRDRRRPADGGRRGALAATATSFRSRASSRRSCRTSVSSDYLGSLGLALERTAVGDRYVLERMREAGYNVGGEQSGHIILSDFTTTGDGLVAALQVLAVVKTLGPAGQRSLPSVRSAAADPQERARATARCSTRSMCSARVDAAREKLGAAGRLVIRPSGTEPVIRVMGEGDDRQVVETVGRRNLRRPRPARQGGVAPACLRCARLAPRGRAKRRGRRRAAAGPPRGRPASRHRCRRPAPRPRRRIPGR